MKPDLQATRVRPEETDPLIEGVHPRDSALRLEDRGHDGDPPPLRTGPRYERHHALSVSPRNLALPTR